MSEIQKYSVGYFDEKRGVRSYTRLTSFIAFVVACIVTMYSLYSNANHFELIVTFLAYSGGQKVVQKYTEKLSEKLSEKQTLKKE